MLHILAVVLLPLMLVFGVYHLAVWICPGPMFERAFWRRVALASALTHVLLLSGTVVFVWADYRAARALPGGAVSPEAYLAGSDGLVAIVWVVDPLPTLVLMGALALMAWAGVGSVASWLAVAVFAVLGTLQWYWLGGSLGLASERLWAALAGGEDDLPGWF